MFRPLALVAALLFAGPLGAQTRKGSVKLTETKIKTESVVFKTTPQGELKLHIHYPPDWTANDRRPAIVFFFGGGWKNGSFEQFVPQSEYFASRGLLAVSADYRIESKHKTTPDVCVEDAKSALRFVRANAAKYGVDPDKLIASGGSAGGHLAAATALVAGFDAKDDPKVSAKPNALVLFNPALNLTMIDGRKVPGANGEDVAKAISPTLYLAKDAPPAIVFFGTADKLKSHGTEYAAKAKALGVRVEFYTAADQPHGFFNRSPWCEATAERADRFLESLGYLKGEPTVKTKPDAILVRE
jgi:acetyl esterase